VRLEAEGVSKKEILIAQSLVLVMTAFVLAIASLSHAQPKKIPRVGYLAAAGDVQNPGPQIEIFRQGLRDLGYVEEKNIQIQIRYAEGKIDRIPSLVTELVRLNVDVLVASAITAIRAAKEATTTVPIVMVTIQDPVATGIIASLARPGGNITGITRLTRELGGKRLQLLTEIVPGISRVGVLGDAKLAGSAVAFKEYEEAARSLRIPLQYLEARGENPDLEAAFRMARAHVGALVTIGNPVLNGYTKRIAQLAIKNRVPSMFEGSDWVEAGGLASYSSSDVESFRRVAVYVDKILKGAKPADLPVEQPKKFDFVINLKTAKQIGLTIPPNVLARADRVIR
jgi:putative ABC transport system substrate-binding protein